MKTMFLFDHTGFSEHNYEIIKDINETVINRIDEVSLVVNDTSSKIIEVNTSVANVAEIGCFQDGVLVATSVVNANQILSARTSSRKILYLWDVDWLHTPLNYEFIYDTLTDDKLEIIVRSESHREAVLNILSQFLIN